ncbi:MAG: glycosyltransferase [Bacteroidales bacterium]|nr:glycosyltransferase [Bacteroidales bacterium]
MLILLIIPSLYFIVILFFLFGWQKLKISNEKVVEFEVISVVVAAKNEEENILNLLNDIVKQNYPLEKFELILIDDNSSDETYNIAFEFQKTHKNFKLLKNQLLSGKKSAINFGIENSMGKLIVTIDADCRVGESWLSEINKFYSQTKAKMIIAPVVFSTNKKIFSFDNFQALEFLSLQASTAGAVGINSPIMCNGANLIFEKTVFSEFENPHKKEIESGDDMFLMLNIKKRYPNQIKYLKHKDAIVTTKPTENIKQFVNQRIRWASKSAFYKDFFVNFTGIIVFVMNISVLSAFIGAILKLFSWDYFLLFFTAKTIVDFPLLFTVSKFYSMRRLMFLFLPLQIIYPIYVVVIGFLSFFVKTKWKKTTDNKQ